MEGEGSLLGYGFGEVARGHRDVLERLLRTLDGGGGLPADVVEELDRWRSMVDEYVAEARPLELAVLRSNGVLGELAAGVRGDGPMSGEWLRDAREWLGAWVAEIDQDLAPPPRPE